MPTTTNDVTGHAGQLVTTDGTAVFHAGDSQQKKFVVIVDAYSTGFYYLLLFRERGYHIIHVRSNLDDEALGYFKGAQAKVEAFMGQAKATEDEKEEFKGTSLAFTRSPSCQRLDIESTDQTASTEELTTDYAEQIVRIVQGADGKLTAVLAGTETGVELAATIGEALKPTIGFENVIANSPAKSATWRDKFQMQKALADAELPHIKSCVTKQWDDVLAFAQAQWQARHIDVVIKPLSSAGSDNVYFCKNETQLKDAFDTIMGASNVLNEKNEAVIIQQCITGIEYMVNTMSLSGKTVFTDIHEIHKRRVQGPDGKETIIYDWERILRSDAPDGSDDARKYATIEGYVPNALKALGIDNGPGHTEVILQPQDDGNYAPVMVESANRPGGSVEPTKILEPTYGQWGSQVHATVAAVDEPHAFLERLSLLDPKTRLSPTPKVGRGNLYAIYLIQGSEETITARQPFRKKLKEFCEELVSQRQQDGSESICRFAGDHLYLKPEGEQAIPRTVDLVNCPGIVYFECGSYDIFQQVLVAFRAREAAFYQGLAVELERSDAVSLRALIASGVETSTLGSPIYGPHGRSSSSDISVESRKSSSAVLPCCRSE